MPEHELPGAVCRVPGALLPRGNGFSVLRIFLIGTPRSIPGISSEATETQEPLVRGDVSKKKFIWDQENFLFGIKKIFIRDQNFFSGV